MEAAFELYSSHVCEKRSNFQRRSFVCLFVCFSCPFKIFSKISSLVNHFSKTKLIVMDISCQTRFFYIYMYTLNSVTGVINIRSRRHQLLLATLQCK